MSASGGPTHRTYTVNPKHMRVNLPTHVPGSDQLVPLYGAWSEDVVLHMMLRIRIGEVSRETADALPLGSGGIETLPCSRIAALDRMYENIITDMPSIFAGVDETCPDDEAARRVALQRSLGRLSLYARRARLLRPLLQANNLPRQFDVLRRTCLDSTEVVMGIASRFLGEAVHSPGSTGPHGGKDSRRIPYRGGLVINHLFVACAVLATDPALRGDGSESSPDAGTERRRAALANACRLLDKTGEKRVMAANMVRRLVTVLRKHRVHVVDAGSHRPLGTETLAVPDQEPARGLQIQASVEQQAMITEPTSFVTSQQQPVPPDWEYGLGDSDGLNGIWNDFLRTNPTDDGWQQLFADLDSSEGGGMY